MSNPTSSGGGGWQILDYAQVWTKIRWIGDAEDWKMLVERGEALGLIKKCTNRGDRMKHNFSPEFFQQIEDARDGLLGFIVSGDPKLQHSTDPRVPRPLEGVRRQIHVPGRQTDSWDLWRRQMRRERLLRRGLGPFNF